MAGMGKRTQSSTPMGRLCSTWNTMASAALDLYTEPHYQGVELVQAPIVNHQAPATFAAGFQLNAQPELAREGSLQLLKVRRRRRQALSGRCAVGFCGSASIRSRF